MWLIHHRSFFVVTCAISNMVRLHMALSQVYGFLLTLVKLFSFISPYIDSYNRWYSMGDFHPTNMAVGRLAV